jgi:hypothetical protein
MIERNDLPHVTLSAKGVILMNQIAFESFGSPENVTPTIVLGRHATIQIDNPTAP